MSANTPTPITNDACQTTLFIAGDYYFPSIIVNLLRNQFSGDATRRIPALRDIVWSANIAQGSVTDTRKAIKIQQWSEFDPSTTNVTPAIIVKNNDTASGRIGIADRHSWPSDSANTQSYSRVWSGSLTIFCISKQPGLCHLLAWEAATYLEEISPALRAQLGLRRLDVSKVGSVKPIREFPQNFASPVTLEYTFIRGWQLTPAEPILQHVRPNLTNT